jgi:hypothetical protein
MHRRHYGFLKELPLHLPREHKLERFLTVLAQKDVAASTQGQALVRRYPNAIQTKRSNSLPASPSALI